LTQENHPWQETNKQSIPNARRRRRIEVRTRKRQGIPNARRRRKRRSIRIRVRTRKKPSMPNARRRRRIEVTIFVDPK
jgi:hypothetical protein